MREIGMSNLREITTTIERKSSVFLVTVNFEDIPITFCVNVPYDISYFEF